METVLHGTKYSFGNYSFSLMVIFIVLRQRKKTITLIVIIIVLFLYFCFFSLWQGGFLFEPKQFISGKVRGKKSSAQNTF